MGSYVMDMECLAIILTVSICVRDEMLVDSSWVSRKWLRWCWKNETKKEEFIGFPYWDSKHSKWAHCAGWAGGEWGQSIAVPNFLVLILVGLGFEHFEEKSTCENICFYSLFLSYEYWVGPAFNPDINSRRRHAPPLLKFKSWICQILNSFVKLNYMFKFNFFFNRIYSNFLIIYLFNLFFSHYKCHEKTFYPLKKSYTNN